MLDDDYTEYEQGAQELLGLDPSARAQHRARVMSVLDPELFMLAETAYELDLHVIFIAQRLNALAFDVDDLTVKTAISADGDLTPVFEHMKVAYLEDRPSWAPPGFEKRLSLRNDREQIQDLIDMLRRNAEAVTALRTQVGAALREHFTLADLL